MVCNTQVIPMKAHDLTYVLSCLGILGLACVPAVAGDGRYVELCKTFGRGYLQLPGSDTCLKASGIVRGQLDFNLDNASTKEESKSVLSLSFGTNTSFGKLIGKFSFEAAGNPARSTLKPKFSEGVLALGKYKIGFSASNWVRFDWGGYNIKSGPFGYHKADMIAFEDTIAGLKLRLAAEYPENTIQQFPSMIGHISKSGKWASVFVSGAIARDEDVHVRVVKSGVVFKLNKLRKGARLKFQATFGQDDIGKYLEGERWDFIAGLSLPITKKLTSNFTFGTSDIFSEEYSLAANLVWRPVSRFKIIGELSFVKDGEFGGLIRVQRTF